MSPQPHLNAKWAGVGLLHRWSRWSLFRQFMVASIIVPCLGMLAIGFWIADRIEDGVVQGVTATSAVYTDALISPHVQALAHQDQIDAVERQNLDTLMAREITGKHITSIKIWKGNTIVYATDKELEGKSFPTTGSRLRSWQGEVTVKFDDMNEPDEVHEKALALPVLEFYAPVREDKTNNIIALVETYEVVPHLREKLASARFKSWFTVLIATLHLIALQAVIVHSGSETIEAQRLALNARVGELSESLAENETLRRNASEANRRVSEINERFLHRLGADLHDGPVQLLGMSLLRLDSLTHTISQTNPDIMSEATEDIDVIRQALHETLEEIRSVSGGLAPPEIEKMPLSGALEMVAKRHQQRTGSSVQVQISRLPAAIPYPIKVCLYRFAQEGLNNAFRHAGGEGQTIHAACTDDLLEIEILDTGPGFEKTESVSSADLSGGQGLLGLRDRIEALGGQFTIATRQGKGTRLTARFSLKQGAPLHGQKDTYCSS